MNRSMSRALLVLLPFAVSCHGSCGLDLERMIDQPRYATYQRCEVCPDDTIMMSPPPGTVSRMAVLGPSALTRGRVGASFVDEIPVAVDRAVLVRGKNRFDIFCAACHGRRGDSLSQVAENMTLRRPPNLLAAPYTTYPPGRVFAAITDGFGLMRSYAAQLPIDDRWAVVAYLEALQLAQHVSVDELPPAAREEAQRWLR